MIRSFDQQGRHILKQAALISRSSASARTSTEHKRGDAQARKTGLHTLDRGEEGSGVEGWRGGGVERNGRVNRSQVGQH